MKYSEGSKRARNQYCFVLLYAQMFGGPAGAAHVCGIIILTSSGTREVVEYLVRYNNGAQSCWKDWWGRNHLSALGCRYIYI